MADPVFDPSQPFETVDAPRFDPSQPFETVNSATAPAGTAQPETYQQMVARRKTQPFLQNVGEFAGDIAGGIWGGVKQTYETARQLGAGEITPAMLQDPGRAQKVIEDVSPLLMPASPAMGTGRGIAAASAARTSTSAAEMAPFQMHPQAPTPVVRPDNGARLLPPDVPHDLPPETPTIIPKEPGRAGVGAQAARGPLAEVSPSTIDHLRGVLAGEQFTPWSLEQRLDEMSPHQFLGELTPNTETRMSGLASFPGQSRTEIVNAVRGRAAEQPQRLRELLDTAFGPAEDLSQNRRLLDIQQQQQAGPLYRAFRQVSIPPTDQMLALMPRLRSAGVIGQARRIAGIEGIPWDQAFETMGQEGAEMVRAPTASSWDLLKRGLDVKIEQSLGDFGKPTNMTRVLTGLKQDLIGAIDNHPDPSIGQMWRTARDTFAGPAQVKAAQQMGRQVLSDRIDANELPFLTAGYSQPQMMGLAQGIRAQFENLMGRAGPQGRRTINQVLSPNNQQKIRWVIGDQPADQLFSGVEKEAAMHDAPTRLVGGSPTASRVAAQADYAAKPPLISPQNALRVGRAILHPTHAIGHEAAGIIGRRMNAANEAQAVRLREETARLMTLQGPERDAVLRWLIPQPQEAGRFARGGKVGHFRKKFHPQSIGARKAKDGRWYIRDKARPGKFLEVRSHV